MVSRLAVVGCEASGKTVFMAALADYFRLREDRLDRPCLVPENADANRFAAFLNRQMRVLRQWPPATPPERTIRMDWTLRRGGNVVANVGMIEFGGETFRAAFREGTPTVGDVTAQTSESQSAAGRHVAAVDELERYLAGADYVILLVSLREIFRNPVEVSAEEFERETEAQWVTRGLISFVREKLPKARLVIGLTQADRYRDELAKAGGGAAAFARYWPSVRAVSGEVPIFEVASVSGVDGEGQPAENYDTDGVASVMEDFLNFVMKDGRKGDRENTKGNRHALRKVLAAALLILTGLGGIMALRPVKPPESFKPAESVMPLKPAESVKPFKPAESVKPFKPAESVKPLKPAESVKPTKLSKAVKPLTNEVAKLQKPQPPPPDPRQMLADLEGALRSERIDEASRLLARLVTTNSAIIATNTISATTNSVSVLTNSADRLRLDRAVKLHRWLVAALDGEVAAQNRLALAYYVGTAPVKRDYAKALIWYRLSAEAGDAEAQMCLAVMYEEGKGVAADSAAANSWYRRAAANGAPDAMYRMGTLAFAGNTPESRAEAHEWFGRAKSAGCKIENLDDWIRATAPKNRK